MKTGLIISGTTHLVLFLVAMLNLSFFNVDPKEVPLITEVSILTEEEFQESLREDAPEILADIGAMFQPTTEDNDAERPDDAIAPEQTEMDVTEDPSERDTDADISGAFILAQPDVEVEAVVIAAPTFEAPPSPTMGLGETGNTAVPTLGASPAPRSAPRIDAFAAPALPSFETTSDRTVEETIPDETIPEPVEEDPAESQPDSVAEILPEAQEDGSDSAAPPRASTPPRRSNNIAQIQEEFERANNPVEEPEVVEAADGTVDDLLAGLNDEPAPQAPSLTGAQSRSIGQAVSQNWVKEIIIGKADYERLVIRLSVSVGPDGKILGNVQPVEPANPTGDFQVAYEAARRAVLKAREIPLPPGYPDGVTLILRFDPVLGVGLN